MSAWADDRLAYLYHKLEGVRDDLPEGSTEAGCVSDALKAVELADVYVEKRLREDAQDAGIDARCPHCTRNGWYESFSGGFAHEMPCEHCNPQGLRRGDA